jgi:hypothetical protein
MRATSARDDTPNIYPDVMSVATESDEKRAVTDAPTSAACFGDNLGNPRSPKTSPFAFPAQCAHNS